MTLEQLRIFIAVAEREHITAAAKALHITQSAASAAIAALENHHGVRLFHRVGRGIMLSDAGRLFLEEARQVLARAAAAQATLDDLGDLRRGTLRLVASQTIAAYWLPPFLALFQARHPGLAVELVMHNTHQAAALVCDGSVELGFVEGWVDTPALARWQVGGDQLCLVSHRPFPAPAPTATWLAQARWVMREAGSGTRSALDAALQAMGIDPLTLQTALVLPSNESVRTAAEAGAGVAALSSLVVAPSLAVGTLWAASSILAERPFYALRHKERYRSKAAEAFLAFLSQETRQQDPMQP